jgi:RimJ/RimL family protein N-acetyltransferase
MANDLAPPSPVRLCAVRPDDLPWMAAMASDPVAVGAHNWGGTPQDPALVEAGLWTAFDRDGLLAEGEGSLIVELEDGTRIGSVSWRTERWGPSQGSRCPAFGIALLPEFRGRGFGTEAQRQLIDHLFESTPANRVQSDTAADNPAEQASLRKAGMTAEGVVRAAEYRDGAYHDHILFSILRSEWADQRASGLDAEDS